MSKPERLDRACRDLTRALMVFMDVLAVELATIRETVPPHSHECGPAVPVRAIKASAKRMPAASRPAPIDRKPSAKPHRQVHHITTWTQPRVDILARDYPAGEPLDAILERVNACEAPTPVKRNGIAIEAARRGLRRPMPQSAASMVEPAATPAAVLEDTPHITVAPVPEAAPPTDAAPAVQAPVPDKAPAATSEIRPATVTRGAKAKSGSAQQPVAASYEQILQWAGPRGIVVRGRNLPLEDINARRRNLGQPPFVLAPATPGRAA